MKNEAISQKLYRLLDDSVGKHSQIAKGAGISQATISRIYLRKVSPSLRIAEALMASLEAEAGKNAAPLPAIKAGAGSALRIPNAKRVRIQRAGATAATALA